MEKIPMTAAGYAVLESELKHRQQVERPRIIQQITDARTHGDLSENAEYHAAKESQSLNEGRIAELEYKLARAEVIDVSKLSGDTVKLLEKLGFKVMATGGTQRYLSQNGVASEKINKVLEGRPHIVDRIKNGGVQLVFNTTDGAAALTDSRSLRRAALLHKVPYYTTLAGAVAAAQGIKAHLEGDLQVRALQSYFGGKA